jgi:release factor glutamine methyltransferase
MIMRSQTYSQSFQYSSESVIILEKLTGLSKTQIWLGEFELTSKQKKDFEKKQELLRKKIPLDYILGEVVCQDLSLKVNKNTLIPRPETEFWLTKMVKNLQNPKNKIKILLEIGTGSGLIALTLAKKLKNWQIVATDYSQKTLQTAQENFFRNQESLKFGLESGNKASFIQADLLSFDLEFLDGLDWILVANLPYLPNQDRENAQENRVEFEPKNALYSGKDGLKHFNKLIKQLAILTQIDKIISKPNLSGKQNKITAKKTANTNLEKVETKAKIQLPSQIYLELDPRNIQKAQQKLDKLYTKYLQKDANSKTQKETKKWQSQIWLDENGLERLLFGKVTKIPNGL